VDWKAQRLTDLVHILLHDVVQAQYKDVRLYVSGRGDFELTQAFHRFLVPPDIWSMQGKLERKTREPLQEVYAHQLEEVCMNHVTGQTLLEGRSQGR